LIVFDWMYGVGPSRVANSSPLLRRCGSEPKLGLGIRNASPDALDGGGR
jgi:hypothetical protein